MSIIIAIVVALFSPAEGLRRTAPLYLTEASASEHMLAAHIAGAVYDLEPELLLAIADHESHYTITFTPEAGAKTSCGVMTPEPLAVCTSSSILDGYLAGARHLRGWIDGPHTYCGGNRWCGELGYAGGNRMIAACRLGPVLRERGHGMIDLCKTPQVFRNRAAWIRSSIERVRRAANS